MSSAAPTALRVLVTLFAVFAIVGQVAYLDALAWHTLGLAPAMGAQMRPPFLTLMTSHAAVSAVSALLAIALALHEGPREAAARMLGLALGAWSYLTAYSGVTLLLRDPGGTRSFVDAHFLLVEVVGLAALIRFTALFPHTLRGDRLEPPANLPAALRPIHAATVWMLRPAAPWIAGTTVVAGLGALMLAQGEAIGDAGLHPSMDVARFLAAGLVVLNLRRSWIAAESEDGERLTWLVAGLAFLIGALLLFIGGNVLMAVAEWPEPVIAWRPLLMDLGVVGFLVGLAMAVLYRGRLAAGAAASRIASFTGIVALGLFLAAGLEALLAGNGVLGFSLRTGVGTMLALTIVLSNYRGLGRAFERTFAQLPRPGSIEGSAA